MIGNGPDAGFFRTAEEAGMIYELNGSCFVAGSYREPISGELCCLVEYADHDLLSDQMSEFLEALQKIEPGAQAIIIRSTTTAVRQHNFRPALSYMVFKGNSQQLSHQVDGQLAGQLKIRRSSGGTGENRLRSWLTQALVNGSDALSEPYISGSIAVQVDSWLADPARVSFLALLAETPVGHLTLLIDSWDEVEQVTYIDLVDVLVDPIPAREVVRDRLVQAAAHFSEDLGRPLVGHVVHSGNSDDVVSGLEKQGWLRTCTYWKRRIAKEK